MEKNKELCGIIPVNKPQGWTSFDVVAKLRGILKLRRLGHAGTLDPMATGVLPVFAGKATKACDLLGDSEKIYLAGFRLGISTDTQDITGRVLSESGESVSLERLEAVKQGFIGDIMQLPPMYSAVKSGGKKLYELARQGKTVEREARPRHIDYIDIIEYDPEKREGRMRVSVSRGTYIRTLINDIGEALGCGGTMTSLVRTNAAGFSLEQCCTPEEIQQAADENRLGGLIRPLEDCFRGEYEELRLGEKNTALYKNGVKLRPEQAGIKEPEKAHGQVFCVFGFDGEFLGLGRADIVNNEFRSVKNFY
ncbi:tRNA pseudouridine(55) synthase TruB [Ruminococcus sp. Marseille-P6503]|uniref:tRNA pseudouridine(55) synthase TruB n=1 Tax=Ruminococcus sp. Marseille-P6503 TaxID=2364796 RepID=UPI000F5324E2|nr:tRNA pseudouridine(55) synthase TruB [Ruminococcus sp. Marseille-P6503]